MDKLEATLNDMLVKNAPFQIPENGRKWIAEYAWVFAVIGLVMGGLAFFPLLAAVGLVSAFGTAVGAGSYVFAAWLSLLVLLAYLVVLVISIPKLKNQQRSGWELTYYSTLFFFVYDVFAWLTTPSMGAFFGLMWNVVALVVALYILFQVKSHFTK